MSDTLTTDTAHSALTELVASLTEQAAARKALGIAKAHAGVLAWNDDLTAAHDAMLAADVRFELAFVAAKGLTSSPEQANATETPQ